jgi:hypothetical protein
MKGGKYVMQNRRERDEELKQKLIEKFGYGEFKASWEELSELLELDLPKTKYHIMKLDSIGFISVIDRSQRSGGYTSPNVIVINGGEGNNIAPEDIMTDIKKYIILLEKKVQRTEVLENENRRLTKALTDSEASNKRLFQQIQELRNQIFERK